MKNQYFGDVNDYRKYGLLRRLAAAGFGHLVVAWMLTPNDGSGDGEIRAYLKTPEKWATYDPDLYDGLRDMLRGDVAPDVSRFEASRLLQGVSFYSRVVPDARVGRAAWHQGLLDSSAGADLVFVDPDNGIEVRSKPIGRRGSSKYAAWSELESLWNRGSSVVLYQHFRRQSRRAFASTLAHEFAFRTGARLIEMFQTAHALFLLAAQDRHEAPFFTARREVQILWPNQIKVVGLANKALQPTSGEQSNS
jgi:hypothetical protein